MFWNLFLDDKQQMSVKPRRERIYTHQQDYFASKVMQFVVGKVEIHMQTPKLPSRQNDFKNAKLTFLYIFVTANP